ncbi:hypothetical protein [Arachidicoccus ginsenosidivorans]|uniref:hypothetical protein n=1 Tax=Arachidicoccus ginsenosidivorans TaxID=496057 RepID=UPI001CEF7C34|nr:hypothetical protein [Arachidicoccus ginsenosidivorans]
MDRNKVVLVDENDLALGEMNKLEAHKKGNFIVHFLFLFSIIITKCCFTKGLIKSITVADCGQMPVALTHK